MDETQQMENVQTYGDIATSAKNFARLKNEEKALKDSLDKIKRKIEPLHEELLSHMEAACIANMRIDGLTLYLHAQVWAKLPEGVEKSALVSRLKSSPDTEFLVSESYNANQLSAFVREMPDGKDGSKIIPDNLKDVLESNEVVQVRARKSS